MAIRPRNKKREVAVGGVRIGDAHPISIQSMTNTDTRDAEATLLQISGLVRSGCDIVRVAVPDMAAAEALHAIVKGSPIPVVADIHFDYRLALASVKAGVAKLRINPGNVGGKEKIREVVHAARDAGIPIRIGVNAGSLEKGLLEKFGKPTPEALVESAASHVRLLEDECFDDIVISLKASDVMLTVESYRMADRAFDYPLHLGVTEAGTEMKAAVRSGVGLGILLAEGIGDTIRVSITGPPHREVIAAKELLGSLGLRGRGVKVVSCPTCGRCRVDLLSLADKVDAAVEGMDATLTVAVMGCAVNGPGEAREADIGIAGGDGEFLLFRKGVPIGKFSESEALSRLIGELESLSGNSDKEKPL